MLRSFFFSYSRMSKLSPPNYHMKVSVNTRSLTSTHPEAAPDPGAVAHLVALKDIKKCYSPP